MGSGGLERGVSGKGFSDAAELPAFEGDAALGEEFCEVGLGEAEGVAGFGLESAVEAVAVAGAVDGGEEIADLVGELFGAAEVEPVLASLIAVGQLVVGAEAFAVVGAPGCGDGALVGEDAYVGFDEVLDVLEAGGVLLVLANRIAFFRVGGAGRGSAFREGTANGR